MSYVLVCVGVVLELNKLQATVELTVGSLSPQSYSECLGPKMVCSRWQEFSFASARLKWVPSSASKISILFFSKGAVQTPDYWWRKTALPREWHKQLRCTSCQLQATWSRYQEDLVKKRCQSSQLRETRSAYHLRGNFGKNISDKWYWNSKRFRKEEWVRVVSSAKHQITSGPGLKQLITFRLKRKPGTG